jgi:hypothetical protein
MSNVEMSVDLGERSELMSEMAPRTVHTELLSVELTTVLWLVLFILLRVTFIVVEIETWEFFNHMGILASCCKSAKSEINDVFAQLSLNCGLIGFWRHEVCICVHIEWWRTLTVGIIYLVLAWLKGSKRNCIRKFSFTWWGKWFKLFDVLKPC